MRPMTVASGKKVHPLAIQYTPARGWFVYFGLFNFLLKCPLRQYPHCLPPPSIVAASVCTMGWIW